MDGLCPGCEGFDGCDRVFQEREAVASVDAGTDEFAADLLQERQPVGVAPIPPYTNHPPIPYLNITTRLGPLKPFGSQPFWGDSSLMRVIVAWLSLGCVCLTSAVDGAEPPAFVVTPSVIELEGRFDRAQLVVTQTTEASPGKIDEYSADLTPHARYEVVDGSDVVTVDANGTLTANHRNLDFNLMIYLKRSTIWG